MLVDALKLDRSTGMQQLSARVGPVALWFRFPAEVPPPERIDPFVPAALLAAMSKGEPLEVASSYPVSSRLLEGIQKIQHILNFWNPALSKVPVEATEGPDPPRRDGGAAFFSGGVDSLYTFLKHSTAISRLLLIHGLEITLENGELFEGTLAAVRRFAKEEDRELVPILTNLRELADAHRLSNYLFQAAILAGAALCAGYRTTYVAAGRTYADLAPLGSHPLLDPLWSTETCELVHDGVDCRRIDKVGAIARSEAALRVLRVCLGNGTEYNCGRCEKCLRTMITLRLLQVDGPTFPALSLGAISKMELHVEAVTFLLENLDLAEKVGDDEIAGALRAALRRYRVLQLVKDADELLLGNLIRRARRALRGDRPEPPLIDSLPERFGARRSPLG